jgi:hypothetical protein
VTIKQTIRKLQRGLKRLETKGWTQGWFARDKYGVRVEPTSPKAVCFCVLGAVDEDPAARNALQDTLNRSPKTRHLYVANFNDTQRTVGPVLTLFRKTIKRLEQEAAK